MNFRSYLESAAIHVKSPVLMLEKVEVLYYSLREQILDSDDGIDVLAQDWDILVILDACRYDMFSESVNIPGCLKKVKSKASKTDQFLRKNFDGRDLRDTVYVTGNPQFYRIQNGIYDVDPIDCEFYQTVDVWQDRWDEDHQTVRPEDVTEASISAAEKHPNKRLIVHYVQPHAPYIGPIGREELPADILDLWKRYKMGQIDFDLNKVRQAYQENLEIALQSVGELFENIDGKFVVTADHGEMLGDRSGILPIRKYGHPAGMRTPELINVPWFEYESGSRRKVTAEDSNRNDQISVNNVTVKQRLRDLGYSY